MEEIKTVTTNSTTPPYSDILRKYVKIEDVPLDIIEKAKEYFSKEYITVAQLIEQLKKCDQSAYVGFENLEYGEWTSSGGVVEREIIDDFCIEDGLIITCYHTKIKVIYI